MKLRINLVRKAHSKFKLFRDPLFPDPCPHHCAMNRGCGAGWVSSFIIAYYNYLSGEAIYPSVWFKPSSGFSLCSN